MKKQKDNSQSCGTCRYLERHKTFEVPCINLGKISTSASCTTHSPDVFSLVNNPKEKDNLIELSKMLIDMSPNQLGVLSELLKVERRTRKKGFYLMQRVYVRVRGNKDYFSNFVEAFVLMAEKNQILLVDEGCAHHWYLDFTKKLTNSLYTEAAFIPIREEMFNEGKFVDPEIERNRKRFESAQKARAMGLDEAENLGLAPKKKKTRKDLFDIAQRLSKGYIRKPREEDEESEVKVSHD